MSFLVFHLQAYKRIKTRSNHLQSTWCRVRFNTNSLITEILIELKCSKWILSHSSFLAFVSASTSTVQWTLHHTPFEVWLKFIPFYIMFSRLDKEPFSIPVPFNIISIPFRIQKIWSIQVWREKNTNKRTLHNQMHYPNSKTKPKS